MYKVFRGKKAVSFGVAEKAITLNWKSLGISLSIALITWAGAHLIPSLQEVGGIVGAIAGLIAQASPMILLWLRSNQDLTVDKKL